MDTERVFQERSALMSVVTRDSASFPSVRLGEHEITVFEWQRLKERVDRLIWEQLDLKKRKED